MNMFEFVGGTFFSYVDYFVNSVSAQLSLYVAVVALAAATLYYMFVGYAVMRGEVQEPIKTIVWRSIKMAMILFVACGTGVYQTEVIGTVNSVSAGLMNSIANANPVTAGNFGCGAVTGASGNMAVLAMLDCNVAKGMVVFEALFDAAGKLGWYEFHHALMLILPAIIYAACYAVMLLAVGVEFFINMLTLHLVLAVGPLFIGALAFEPSKSFFEGWKNKIIYCLILQLFIMILIGLAFSVISGYIAHSGFGTTPGVVGLVIDPTLNLMIVLKIVFNLCVVVVLFSYMFTKLDNIAASITGGGDSGSGLGMMLAVSQIGKMLIGRDKKEGKQGGNIENSSPAGGGGKSGMSVAHRIAQRMRGK